MTNSQRSKALPEATAETLHTESLPDIRDISFDKTLPRERRPGVVLETLQNPFSFRCGGLGIQLSFAEDAPPLEELLLDYLLRKKSGL